MNSRFCSWASSVSRQLNWPQPQPTTRRTISVAANHSTKMVFFFFHTQSPCSNECGLHWYVNMTTCIVPEEITSCYIIVINLLQNLDTINLVTKSVLDENGDSYIHAETDVRSSNSCYILFASAVNSRWITCNRLADSIECYQRIDETIDWILLTGTYTSGFTIYHFMFFLALTRFHSQWGHHCQPASTIPIGNSYVIPFGLKNVCSSWRKRLKTVLTKASSTLTLWRHLHGISPAVKNRNWNWNIWKIPPSSSCAPFQKHDLSQLFYFCCK